MNKKKLLLVVSILVVLAFLLPRSYASQHLSLRYPGTWRVAVQSDEAVTFSRRTLFQLGFGAPAGLIIQILPNPKGLAVQEWLIAQRDGQVAADVFVGVPPTEGKETTLDGRPCRFYEKNEGAVYLLTTGGHAYQISVEYAGHQSECDALVRSIHFKD